jgi:outer membrane protein assembly factor BamB
VETELMKSSLMTASSALASLSQFYFVAVVISLHPTTSLAEDPTRSSFTSPAENSLQLDGHVENWVHWRGPTADGRAGDHAKPPMQWDKEKNIAWIAELPGEGSATPIVYGNQVFILSAIKTERKSPTSIVKDERAKTTPDEVYYQFVVSSYDRSTGNALWQQVAVEEVPHEGKHATNTYAAGSPVTDGQRLYFSFGSRGIFCYSLDGKLIWRIDLGDMRTRSGWGEAITPALTDDALIVNWDQEEGSFIAALDKQTGQIRWKVDRTDEVSSWNTPLVTTHDGKQQVIVNGTGSVKSYEASTGTVLWECGGQTVNAIPSPIRFRDSVICTSGYRGSLASLIPLNSRGNVTHSNTIGWKITQGTPYVPSPILSGSRLLFTAGNTNLLSCIDASTGSPILERRRLTPIVSMYASPLLANGHFYFCSREGTTVVVKDNEKLDVVAINELGDTIDASPVAVDAQLFLRSWNKLYCIQDLSPVASQSTNQLKANPPTAAEISFKQFNLEESVETSANASLGDLDGDGDLDIVLVKGRHWPLHNRVLFNDGQGKFEGRNLGARADRSYSAALGDIDNDGDLDIVVSNDNPDDKLVYKNDRRGNFVQAGTWGESTWNTRNIGLADLDGDRYPDLVVANRKSRSFVILNDGQGNFNKDRWQVIPAESATTIITADFNGDGLIDLAVPHRDRGVSRIVFNDEKMGFQNTATFGPAVSSARACAAADLNADGAVDLILGDERLGTMVCLNDGKGGFSQPANVGNSDLTAYAIAVGDMNLDQRPDLVIGYSSGGTRVYLNDGSGVRFEELLVGDGQGAVYGIAIGDTNADGRNDIVQGRSEATNTIFFNREATDEFNSPELDTNPWLTYRGEQGPGKGKHIVLIAAEQEYRSEQSMPMMAKVLSAHHGFDCTVLFAVNELGEVDPTLPVYPEKGKEAEFKEHHIPGLEKLASADLVIFLNRLLTLPQVELEHIVKYVDSGKPFIALRTANHGFRSQFPYKINGKQIKWGEDILGGTFLNHHGRWQADSTRGFFDKDHSQHPILTGVNDIWGDSDVYRTYKEGTSLPAECTALVWGQPLKGRNPEDLPNEELEPLPVAWVKPWQTSNGKTARVFHCTMGSASDFKNPGLRRLVVNAVYWGLGLEASIEANGSVDIPGNYQPLGSGFNYDQLGVTPRPVSYYR